MLPPLAVSAYASVHENPDDPAPGIPDDTDDPDDPDDPDKNTTTEVAAAMSSNTAAKASAATRAKKKTTAMKLYYLDSGNKNSVCYDLNGTTGYVILTFYLNGMLPPKGGC